MRKKAVSLLIEIIPDEGFPNDAHATPKGDMPVPCNLK